MTSLRHTALVWMMVLLAVVGAVAVIISYELARSEAAGFLDGQLRQIALNIGRDPEDDFAIGLWNAAGENLPTVANATIFPRQPGSGFSTVKFGGEDWRGYTGSDGSGTARGAQRMSVRQEMAEREAIKAAVPIIVAIPMAWLLVSWSMGRVLGRLTELAQTI